MSEKKTKLEAVTAYFTDDINTLFGKGVVSIIRFGSSVTPDYRPGKSDLNFLVVLSTDGIVHIDKAGSHYKKWYRKKINLPLFLTESYIAASLDSYPVEFLNMQTAYLVVQGKDVLADLSFSKHDVRLQCEREVKGYLLKLRQGFIQTSGSAKQTKLLIAESLTAFSTIFRAMLYLAGLEIPRTKNEVFTAACRHYNLGSSLFSELAAFSNGTVKLSKDELEQAMRRYIAEVKKISELVDKMEIN